MHGDGRRSQVAWQHVMFVAVRPEAMAAVSGNMLAPLNLLTPDPREAAQSPGDGASFTIDLGQQRIIDTIFVGYTNAVDGTSLTLAYGLGSADTAGPALLIAPTTRRYQVARHFIIRLDATVSARYIQIGNIKGGMQIGVVCIGNAIEPIYGQEVGGGRPIVDTGSAERLFGGGWAFSQGARASGYQWTLGDLQQDEVDRLFDLAMSIGTSASVLVAEDIAPISGLNERLHWGVFQKLEAYERLDPMNTRWSFQIGDWA